MNCDPIKPEHRNSTGHRTGLSLLELLVVLTILIALGGIVVSSLPGLLSRTQVATSAANVPEIDSAIRRRSVVSNGQVGDRFDALVIGSNQLSGEVPFYVSAYSVLRTTTLSPSEIAALNRLGIYSLVPAIERPLNATFDSHEQPPVEITASSRVCILDPGQAPELLGQYWNFQPPENARYLVVGIGRQCSISGAGPDAVFSDAPVHFSDNPAASPDKRYSRFMVLIELRPVDAQRTLARYVGTGIPGEQEIYSVSSELERFYSDHAAN